jgi:hypothetical protein
VSDLITIRISPFEALILGTMIKEASDQLMDQVDQLDQDQRFFLSTIQALQKQLPAIEKL